MSNQLEYKKICFNNLFQTNSFVFCCFHVKTFRSLYTLVFIIWLLHSLQNKRFSAGSCYFLNNHFTLNTSGCFYTSNLTFRIIDFYILLALPLLITWLVAMRSASFSRLHSQHCFLPLISMPGKDAFARKEMEKYIMHNEILWEIVFQKQRNRNILPEWKEWGHWSGIRNTLQERSG